jgi:four helix bundle protein
VRPTGHHLGGPFPFEVKVQPFRKLNVWQKAHELALQLYKITRTFPTDERYGLTSQIRRSAASICANLAEGCGRQTRRDFARFAYIALGSASELEYHLLMAADLCILSQNSYRPLEQSVTDVKRMLAGLIRRLMTDN